MALHRIHHWLKFNKTATCQVRLRSCCCKSSTTAIQEGNSPLNFKLNLNNQSISIEFPSPGDTDLGPGSGITINANKISFGSKDIGGVLYPLTGYKNYFFSNGTDSGRILTIFFTVFDFQIIDLLFPSPLLGNMNLYLGISAFFDPRSFSLSRAYVLPCVQLIENSNPPALESYTLDLNLGKLE